MSLARLNTLQDKTVVVVFLWWSRGGTCLILISSLGCKIKKESIRCLLYTAVINSVNKSDSLAMGGSFPYCDWTVALFWGEGYSKLPSSIMGKVKWSQKTGRTGLFDRLGLKDWIVENNRMNLNQRQVKQEMPWSSMELFCHSFFNLLFAYFTIKCLKKHWGKKKTKKRGVIFLLVIGFLSQMYSFPQVSAGVAASTEIRTACSELNTQLSGGGHSIRRPRVSMWGGKGKLTGELSDVSAHDVASAQWHQPLGRVAGGEGEEEGRGFR